MKRTKDKPSSDPKPARADDGSGDKEKTSKFLAAVEALKTEPEETWV